MEIITTGIDHPPKMATQGQEGSGKSRLAASFPKSVFIRAEDRHGHLKVQALPIVTSFNDLTNQLDWLLTAIHDRKSVHLDTADSASKFVQAEVCRRNDTDNIMHPKKLPYYAGFVQAAEIWENEILPRLSRLNEERKMIVNIICQAQLTTVEHPKYGSYPKYALGVDKRVAAKIKKWADIIGLLEFKNSIKNQDDKAETVRFGNNGQRILRLKPEPFWDTKESYNLPEFIEIPEDSPGELNGWPVLSAAIRKGIGEAAYGDLGEVSAKRDAKKLTEE